MRFRTNKLRELATRYWQPTVFYGMLITFFGMLLWFKLGSLVGGMSPKEIEALASGANLRQILDNPINAPFTLLAYLIDLLYNGGQQILPLRAAATIYGLLALSTFYWLVRHWHGERAAILGTVIFGCSAWFLHTARFGTPDVLLFLPIALAAGSVWLKHTGSRVVILAGFMLAAALLYIPGMIWFLVFGAIWNAKTLLQLFKERGISMSLGALWLLTLISPLAWSIYKTPETAKIIAGLPAEGWPNFIDALQRLAEIPYNLLARGPLDPEIWLGRLPILDAFSVVMLIFGSYLYARHWRLARSKTIWAALLIGIIIIGLGGVAGMSLLIPFVYLLVAAGIGFMLDRWHAVFPRNVIAQSFGVAVISVAVIAASWYGLRHYFVAWPNAPATKQTYTTNSSP